MTDASGKPVEGAYVIVKKQGVYYQTKDSADYTGSANAPADTVVANMQPLAWDITDADGKYSFTLPKTGWNDGTKNIEGNGDYTYKLKVEAALEALKETFAMTSKRFDAWKLAVRHAGKHEAEAREERLAAAKEAAELAKAFAAETAKKPIG